MDKTHGCAWGVTVSLYFPSLCPPALWYLGTLIPPPSPSKSFSLLLSQLCSGCISMPDQRRSKDWDIQHLARQKPSFWACCSHSPVGLPISTCVLSCPFSKLTKHMAVSKTTWAKLSGIPNSPVLIQSLLTSSSSSSLFSLCASHLSESSTMFYSLSSIHVVLQEYTNVIGLIFSVIQTHSILFMNLCFSPQVYFF
jgi:hypothetical protein